MSCPLSIGEDGHQVRQLRLEREGPRVVGEPRDTRPVEGQLLDEAQAVRDDRARHLELPAAEQGPAAAVPRNVRPPQEEVLEEFLQGLWAGVRLHAAVAGLGDQGRGHQARGPEGAPSGHLPEVPDEIGGRARARGGLGVVVDHQVEPRRQGSELPVEDHLDGGGQPRRQEELGGLGPCRRPLPEQRQTGRGAQELLSLLQELTARRGELHPDVAAHEEGEKRHVLHSAAMTATSTPTRLAQLPFRRQLARIDAGLGDDEALRGLLLETAALRDHEPLAYLVVEAARARRLGKLAQTLLQALGTLPDTGIQRVLRALDRSPVPDEQKALVVDVVGRALRDLPLERVAAICLMDRWLKNSGPELRAELVEEAVGQCRSALEAGRLEELDDAVLVRVPNKELVALEAELDEGEAKRLTERLQRFAGRALDILGAAPKSLSQANAEELLSRRVYTDPGHFLVELLQNAEDAGASRWQVDIRPDAVHVSHDGLPFDLKDVVGVLSIGQTTKAREQIGFFGVGFKSVYEICERPQVYSGPYCFEIADVSIPRRLAPHRSADPRGTLLVLELRDPTDPRRSPEQLFRYALSVPPQTLLTLPSLARMELRLADGPSRVVYEEQDGPGRIALVHAETGTREGYRVRREHAVFTAEEREAVRSASTGILVAIRLDDEGRPMPLPEDEPTLFSFLPTRERSGLRFMLHAHFDLPVDRERLDLDSEFNRWALQQAGEVLARACAELVAEQPAHAAPLLAVLPLPDELPHPAFESLAERARAALESTAILPAAGGGLLSPRQASLVRPELVDILAGLELTEDGRRAVARSSDGRDDAVASWLGAQGFDGDALMALVARDPDCLDRGYPELLTALAEQAGHPDLLELLGSVPIARDQGGTRRAAGRIARADPALLEVYGDARALLDPAHGASPLLSSWWDALGVPTLDGPALLDDLGDPRIAAALLAPEAARRTLAWLLVHPPCLERFLERCSSGRVVLDDLRGQAVVKALDRLSAELPVRLLGRIASTALFHDTSGVLRPLVGAGAAHLPADEEVCALFPDAPWLAVELRGLGLIGGLGIPALGPQAVADLLCGAGPPDLDFATDERLRAAYGYLGRRGDGLSDPTRDRLADAPIWLDTEGRRAPLAQLRLEAAEPLLSRIYASWGGFAVIDARGPDSALGLAASLKLDDRVGASNHDALVDDLGRGLPVEPVRELLVEALDAAALILAPERLRQLARMPLFVADDGRLRGLAAWTDPLGEGCGRAESTMRGALAHGSRPMLDPAEEQAWNRFLAVAGPARARPSDLVWALENDPTMRRAEAIEEARAVLVRSAATEPVDDALRRRLNALPIWPTRDGDFRPAGVLVTTSSLDALLDAPEALDWDECFSDGDGYALLHERGRAQAAEVGELVTFADAGPALRRSVERVSRPDRALGEQHPLLATTERVAALTHALGSTGDEALALAVDALGRLVRGPLASASELERRIAAGLPIEARLGRADWTALAPAWAAPPLETRKLLAAVSDDSPAAQAVADHPRLCAPERRQALYEWLTEKRPEIEGDEASRSLLARAALWPTPGGYLRSLKSLLLDPDLPDLGLDWNAADEVPEELIQWLRRSFPAGDKQLGIVVDHLLQGHDRAAEANDMEGSIELLTVLARSLRVGEVDDNELLRTLRRQRLHMRLKVLSDRDDFVHVNALLAPEPEDDALLTAFAERPPRRVSDRYRDPSLRRLLALCCKERRLSNVRLRGMMGGERRRPGATATVALARYVAGWARREPNLRRELRLATTAWLPDGDDTLRRPGDLLLPSAEARELLGAAPGLFPHPDLGLESPRFSWLELRPAAAAPPELVVAGIEARSARGEPATTAQLAWLEAALESRHLRPQTLRRALGHLPFLLDDDGRLRRPNELVLSDSWELFGHALGTWGAGREFGRLAAALKVSRHAGKREVLSYLARVADEHERLGADELLRRDPELSERLLLCLAQLAINKGALPARLPLLVEAVDGATTICLTPDARLRVPRPWSAIDEAWRDHPDLLLVLLPHGDEGAVPDLLSGNGIADLRPSPPPQPEPQPREPRPTTVPTPPAPPPAELSPVQARDRSWLERMRQTLLGDRDEPVPTSGRRGQPRGSERSPGDPEQQDRWFRGDGDIEQQLGSEGRLSADRDHAPTFGLAFQPRDLSLPYTYAPSTIAARFSSAGQRWLAMPADPSWRASSGAVAHVVRCRGRLPAGRALLPIPLYGRILALKAEGEATLLDDGVPGPRLSLKAASDVRIEIGLAKAPDFAHATVPPDAPGSLYEQTVPDGELPDELLEFVDSLRADAAGALGIALSIRDFIRRRYAYDPSYLEEPDVGRWLGRLTRGSANAHLAALHAGRDSRFLGRGVCYELNALACELLRRAGIPAAVSTGWVYSGGSLDEPDHMWAMALLQTGQGPRWLPIDASSTRTGRPLRVGRRPPGTWRVPPSRSPPPSPPRWDRPTPRQRPDRKRREPPVHDLLRVVRHLERTARLEPIPGEELRARCRRLLADPESAGQLMALLGDD